MCLQVTTKSGKVRKTGPKGEASSKRKKARSSVAASQADDNDDEKENQGFMSAANFLGKEKAAPPNKKLPGHFFKRK